MGIYLYLQHVIKSQEECLRPLSFSIFLNLATTRIIFFIINIVPEDFLLILSLDAISIVKMIDIVTVKIKRM